MGRAERKYDYVVVGHVSRDVVAATGAEQPGGTAFYAGLQAARLGLRTLVVTAGVPDEVRALLAPWRGELDVAIQPAAETTCFEASGTGFDRILRIRAWAGEIAPPAEGELDAAILHLAPIARETPAQAFGEAGRSARFVGITPQGLIRRWGEDGGIAHVALEQDELPRDLDALVISATELAACGAAMDAAVDRGAVASVTAGEGGAEVITRDGVERAPALRVVEPTDDLGAGDVYAAAFFASLANGAHPRTAMQRGQAASLHKLSEPGPVAIADSARIVELAGA